MGTPHPKYPWWEVGGELPVRTQTLAFALCLPAVTQGLRLPCAWHQFNTGLAFVKTINVPIFHLVLVFSNQYQVDQTLCSS